MGIKTFWLEPSGNIRRSLRIYESADKPCTAEMSYHNAALPIDEIPVSYDEEGYVNNRTDWDFTDPRFPTVCKCGWIFTNKAQKQLFIEELYTCKASGIITTLREASPGAMWNAWWMKSLGLNLQDNMFLAVICPDGQQWLIDSRASNCTMKEDNIHKCWCRHGVPPNITVDKNGNTCQAGGGSIQTGKYHGFLQNGEFNP